MKQGDIAPGQSFGRLTVLGLTHKPPTPSRVLSGRAAGQRAAHCRCECGTEKTIRLADLVHGSVLSCGCLKAERTRERNRTHGLYSHPLHGIWGGLRDRCRNPKNSAYKNYGGRGISVCERWDSFENFLADVGERPSPKHTIDRIDNDGDYEPGNVRWATRSEQMLNRRNYQHRVTRLELRLLMTGNNWPALVD